MGEYYDEPLNNKDKKSTMFNTIVVSFSFLLLFSSYNSSQNMVGQIYQQQGYKYLGNISLFVVYAVFTLSCLFSPLVIKKISYKYCIFLACWGYIFFLGSGAIACSCEKNKDLFYCNEATVTVVNVICSILCGFAASVIWPSASAYISEEAGNTENKELYFSIFSSCALGSQLFGNLSTIVILKYFGHMTYFLMLLGLAVLSNLCILVIKNIRFQEKTNDSEQVDDKQQQQIGFKDMVIRVKNRMQHWEIKQIGVYYFATGYNIGVYTTFLYRIVENSLKSQHMSDEDINVKTGMCYVFLGLIEFLLGFVFKYFLKIVPMYSMQKLSNYVALVYLLTLFLAQYYLNYTLCIVSAVIIGLFEFQGNTVINLIIADDFDKQLEIENFGIFRLIQSLGVVFSIVLIILLNQLEYSEYIFMGISGLVYIVILVVTHNFSNTMQKKKDKYDL